MVFLREGMSERFAQNLFRLAQHEGWPVGEATAPGPPEARRTIHRAFRGRVLLATRRDLRDVLAVVRANPGATCSDIRERALGRRSVAIDAAVRELLERGKVRRERGPRGAWQHFATGRARA
jgi:hypothetical protein